jgi:serine/threonine protein kinase
VYRARDTRLGREVAIKVPSQHLSSNSDVRVRFEHEAKTVSSLNHPHICVLHDVGREGTTDFLVMEPIEGETVAARLMKGALPVAEVVRLGMQIADALDRAHRAGIIHRDLKPGNVVLTRSGAKLMDFGLARATGLAASGSASAATMPALAQSPTGVQPPTAAGTLVGTFQYMAPEQLEGKEADERSDIWALGCVLYGMATGKRAFEGTSQVSLIGAIMNSTPMPVSMVALAPPGLDRLVGACPAKDPADRVQTVHEVTTVAAGADRGRLQSWSEGGRSLVYSVTGRGTNSDVWVAAVDAGNPPAPFLATQYDETDPSISPDGKWIAYVTDESGTKEVFLRPVPNTGVAYQVSIGGRRQPAVVARRPRAVLHRGHEDDGGADRDRPGVPRRQADDAVRRWLQHHARA